MADTAVLSSERHTGEGEPSDQEVGEHGTTSGTASASPADSIKDVAGVENFKPGLRVWLAFLTLCVLTLMVALDGTSISVALPVWDLFSKLKVNTEAKY